MARGGHARLEREARDTLHAWHAQIFRARWRKKFLLAMMLRHEMKGLSMADEPAVTPRKTRRRASRLDRAGATRRALVGVDIAALDPVAVLREIMGDRSQPGSTRVAAARALLQLPEGPDARTVAEDTITERAIKLMAAARKAH